MWQWEPLQRLQLWMSHTEQAGGIKLIRVANCSKGCKMIMRKEVWYLVGDKIVNGG